MNARNIAAAEGSLSFDRASQYYDRTRALPAEAMARVIALLRRELPEGGACLEVGVGTGRIGLPLSTAGIPVVGLDLSAAMLAKLVEKSGGGPVFPLVRGDATRLPFAGDAFGAGLACHVLHLIPEWDDALRELVRVIRPGGKILVDPGGWRSSGTWQHILTRFADEAGLESPFAGVAEPDQIDDFARSLGAGVRALEPIPAVRRASYEEIIGQLENGMFSFTWQLDESQRTDAGRRLREWARRRGPLGEPRDFDFEIHWRAYDLP